MQDSANFYTVLNNTHKFYKWNGYMLRKHAKQAKMASFLIKVMTVVMTEVLIDHWQVYRDTTILLEPYINCIKIT